ncbi:MAG: hypothetical protein C0432_01495 [Candidatus Puniceispirillum sp.]|nr:hypothetical protein [Candidatus Pelagibacter sp.]MBA4282955.1 hypothetical protein [Candidatus Puniceispirillum sp.]
MKRIPVKEYLSFLNEGLKHILIDVRSDVEIESGMIDNAVHLPLHDLNKKLLEMDAEEIQHIVFYCRSGYRSLSACDIAAKIWGTSKEYYSLDGGILAWHESQKVLL